MMIMRHPRALAAAAVIVALAGEADPRLRGTYRPLGSVKRIAVVEPTAHLN
jgi:hypothetical protein